MTDVKSGAGSSGGGPAAGSPAPGKRIFTWESRHCELPGTPRGSGRRAYKKHPLHGRRQSWGIRLSKVSHARKLKPKGERTMRRNFALVVVLLGLGLASAASAQDHGQVGIYGDYVRLDQTSTNLAGLGGRFAVNSGRSLAWEAEMNYDFEQAFTEGFENTSTGSVTLTRTNLRLLQGLFGPKLQTPHGPLRAFVTVKGGFVNFRLDPRPATFATFTSSVQNLRSQDVSGALYPGGGFEVRLGPVGLRMDIGDLIYFNSGAHNNFRVTFGPVINF